MEVTMELGVKLLDYCNLKLVNYCDFENFMIV